MTDNKVLIKMFMLIAVIFLLAGCASWKQNRENLEERAQEYHRMIRWQETNGSVAYVAEALRPAYIERSRVFDTVKIIDYKIKQVELSTNLEKATVTVEYQYHLKNATRIKTLTDTQQWEFYPEAKPSGWRVTSLPPLFP
jgi:outer membrane biogenesis lipoprotein LolB